MISYKVICLLILYITLGASSSLVTFPILQSVLDLFREGSNNGTKIKNITEMSVEELGPSVGVCLNDFIDFASQRFKTQSIPDDRHIQHLYPEIFANMEEPIFANCLLPDPLLSENNTLLMPNTLKEIAELLKPYGNATKRIEPGRCVFIYFYIKSSYACAHMAPLTNVLPILFPTLQFAAIDVQKFPSFNTEFGIVGVPTFMIFHQGKQLVRSFSKFPELVTHHTRIQQTGVYPDKPPLEPLSVTPEPENNWVLHLAWFFITICLAYYFAKTRFCKNIIELIKQCWRESSEAQMAQ